MLLRKTAFNIHLMRFCETKGECEATVHFRVSDRALQLVGAEIADEVAIACHMCGHNTGRIPHYCGTILCTRPKITKTCLKEHLKTNLMIFLQPQNSTVVLLLLLSLTIEKRILPCVFKHWSDADVVLVSESSSGTTD
ncbi:hypothetical protein INR49_027647 [Caranx melampygus]|nr:hypothetical protein INR49_027647 [Caranx melampygus]